jgi:hypothetical protein
VSSIPQRADDLTTNVHPPHLPHLQTRHNAPDSLAGRACRCKCGNVVQVPALAPAAAATVGSIFDEMTTADVERLKNAPRAASNEATRNVNPYQSPTAAHYLARAAADRRHYGRQPASVIRAQWALGTAAVTSFVVCMAVVVVSALLFSRPVFVAMPIPFFARVFMAGAPFGIMFRISKGLRDRTRMSAMSLAILCFLLVAHPHRVRYPRAILAHQTGCKKLLCLILACQTATPRAFPAGERASGNADGRQATNLDAGGTDTYYSLWSSETTPASTLRTDVSTFRMSASAQSF